MKWKKWLTACVVCGMQVAAIGMYFRNQVVGDESGRSRPSPDRDLEAEQKNALAAGVPVQRQRIDDFIEQVREYRDFDSAAAGLSDRVGKTFDVVFAAGLQTQDMMIETEYLMALADRRVSKLYAFLRDMPPEESARKASVLVDEKLATHGKLVEERIEAWRTPEKAAKTPRDVAVMQIDTMRRNYHALSSALFLCSMFCDPETTLSKVDAWNTRAHRWIDEINSDPNVKKQLGPLTSMYCKPQNLFLLNMYVSILEQRWGISPQDAEREAGVHFRYPLIQSRMPLCAWDADTNPFDFTAVHRGVPADTSVVLVEVGVAKSWRNLQQNAKEQEELLARMRGQIEKLDHEATAE